MKKILTTLCLLPAIAHATCSFSPGSCSGSAPASNSTMTGNKSYSSTGTITNLTHNGGILRVCGHLTLVNYINNGAGDIEVEPGGSLTIQSGSVIIDDNWVRNFGELSITPELNINDGYLYTHTGATTRLKIVNLSGGELVNLNKTYAQRITTNSGASLLGTGSCLEADTIINNDFAHYGKCGTNISASIFIKKRGVMNAQLAGSWSAGQLSLIKGAGYTQGGSAPYGTVTVSTNAYGCDNALPVVIKTFAASGQWIYWECAGNSLQRVDLDQSFDGKAWIPVHTFDQLGSGRYYASRGYYRLRVLDVNGTEQYSHTLAILVPDRPEDRKPSFFNMYGQKVVPEMPGMYIRVEGSKRSFILK